MKKLLITLTTALGALLFAGYVYAATTNKQNRILLVEMQPGSASSATDEYIELYNDGFTVQNMKGWKLQYKSANGASWLTKAELTGKIAPGGRYLVATFSTEAHPRQDTLGSGMAQNDGHIRLINTNEEEIDLLGWGNAAEPMVEPAPAPEKEFALKRVVDEDGYFSAEDNNFEDWFISETPSPHGDVWVEEVTAQNPTTKPENGGTTKPSTPTIPKNTNQTSTASYANAKIVITEFLPDPESPQKDADDEFVELYNPNKSPVNLEGYTLESGTDYRYSFTIPNVMIKAGQYLALFSIDTGLTLPNSGSQLRLLSPQGKVLSEFVYDESEPGQSWVKTAEGAWVMTTAPTPNAANTVVGDAQTSGSDSKESTSVSNNAVTLSSGSVLGTDSSEASSTDQSEDEKTRTLNNAVLAGVGVLAVLYAVYEYRHDIGNRIEQFKQYRRNRRQNRGEA